jgi:hypothetical protein
MPKTHRQRRHKGPQPAYSRNIKIFVAVPGEQVKLAGGARKDQPVKSGKDSKPIFLGRQYTGVNRGKVYPYRSAKRGGIPAIGSGIKLAKRKTVAVVDGSPA